MRYKNITLSISILLFAASSFWGCKDNLVMPDDLAPKPAFNSFGADTNNTDYSVVRQLLSDKTGVLWGISEGKVVKYDKVRKWIIDPQFNPDNINRAEKLIDGSLAFYNNSEIIIKTSYGNFLFKNLPESQNSSRVINGISGKSVNDFCIATYEETPNYTYTASIFRNMNGGWIENRLPALGHYLIYNINYDVVTDSYLFIAFKNGTDNDSSPEFKLYSYSIAKGLSEVATSNQLIILKTIGNGVYCVIDNQLGIVQGIVIIPLAKINEQYTVERLTGTSGADLYFSIYNKILHFDGRSFTQTYQNPKTESYITDMVVDEGHLYLNVFYTGLNRDVLINAVR